MYLVTGAGGFIGFHIALELLKRNISVIGVDNINKYYNPKIKNDRIKILNKFSKFRFYKIDLNNKNLFKKKINKYKNKINVIVHLAGQAGVRYSIINPTSYITNNILAYVNLLEEFKNSKKIKLIIYASSSSIYGERKSKENISNFSQSKPLSVYSASKLSMELISNAYSHIYKLNFIGIRFFSVYGPWGRPDMFYFKFLNNIRLKKHTKIYNYGNHHRSFTYIDDVINNIFKIISKFKNSKKRICETFNIGDPNSTSLKKLIDTIENTTGIKSKKKFVKKHPADLKYTKANILREKKLFNHKINTSLKNGIQKLVNWYNFYYN